MNETTPSIDVKVEDSVDIPTPSGVPPTNDDDENFPSPFSSPTFSAPYAGITKSPSASPTSLIRDNSQGEFDQHMSSTSILVTAAGVINPMKAAGFFSEWFHLRAILQQYLPDDFLQWRLHVHRDFLTFLSDGQQQSLSTLYDTIYWDGAFSNCLQNLVLWLNTKWMTCLGILINNAMRTLNRQGQLVPHTSNRWNRTKELITSHPMEIEYAGDNTSAPNS